MANIEEIFNLLSKEKKALKPEYAYKTAEEGLMQAHHFFRWCRNNNLKTTEEVSDQFLKKKVPEQQLQHFGAALVMIDHYITEEPVKQALRDIDATVREKAGKSPLDMIEPAKVERRVLKNIYFTFAEAIDRLKNRSTTLKKSTSGVWLAIAVLFIVNSTLAFTGVYQNILIKTVPQVLSGAPVMKFYGGLILALVLFALPSIVILFANRHRLSEHGKKGSDYPEEIKRMEETLEQYKKKLEEKKIQVQNKES